ncbi:MAG: hypothetical protein COT45_00660 [bacterium (Candidatus Stahlbacteria) CG08_land_8_20_14_0_20_40_26]|nr:MAG: hypothetical protein COT45_00660 [bacterium (Candidatus Stahlbacteria) CG08_land_8_20_14_0_20_40_26]
MPLLSRKEVLNLKLSSIPVDKLRELASNLEVDKRDTGADIVKRLLSCPATGKVIDDFMKLKYIKRIETRRSIISDSELKEELGKVKSFSWGVVQGQLDQKIQAEYVRKIVRYEDLLNSVKAKLHDDVTSYVICTWFNHWTTVLIEEHISTHHKVVPTLKNIKGIDIFFDGQPFDLKVTYLPRDYEPRYATESPKDLAIWMYENQGAQRFGADNRLFVVLLDKDNPEKSWELKRNFSLVFEKIDEFFNKEEVSENDEIIFTFGRKTYTAVSKVLIIAR